MAAKSKARTKEQPQPAAQAGVERKVGLSDIYDETQRALRNCLGIVTACQLSADDIDRDSLDGALNAAFDILLKASTLLVENMALFGHTREQVSHG